MEPAKSDAPRTRVITLLTDVVDAIERYLKDNPSGLNALNTVAFIGERVVTLCKRERVATGESAFDRVLPDTDPKQDPGWRLHIFRGLDESMIVFSEECVLPEKVLDPDARVMFAKMRVWLTTEQQRWLRDQLNELLGEG